MAWTEEQMCQAAAGELKDGYYVNLGIGIPTHVANYLAPGIEVIFHSENGILGMGPFPLEEDVDPDIINAGKQTVSELPCTCYVDSVTSFAIVRSGHINVTILGGLQVSETADLANWTIPGKLVRGMGGAMDLVAGVGRVVVIMTHNAKDGAAKLKHTCSLPITGKGVVDRVITNLGIFDFAEEGLSLTELANGVSLDEIKKRTEASFLYNSQKVYGEL